MKRQLRFLFASLAVHATLLALLMPLPSLRPKPTKKELLEIELKPSLQPSSNLTSQNSEPERRPRTNNRAADPSRMKSKVEKNVPSKEELLKKLTQQSYDPARLAAEGSGPARGEGSNPPRQHSGAWNENGYTTKDDPSVAWGAGSGTFERVQDLTLMSKMQQKIDALLFYPGVLARREMSGTVNARLVINQAGSCDWNQTKIASADPYFRVFILHLLKKVCTENFKKYTHGRELTNVDLSFKFELGENIASSELTEDNQHVLGNVLLFYRYSRRSVAEWHLGPFTGVFPIPWVTLDWPWVVENWDTYVNKKDPLGEMRVKDVDTFQAL